MIATVARLAGELPDGLDSDQAQNVVLGMLAICVIGLFIVIRTVQKVTTRLVLAGLLVAAGAGLWIQREHLQDCAGQCECRLFGQDVRVPDAQGICR